MKTAGYRLKLPTTGDHKLFEVGMNLIIVAVNRGEDAIYVEQTWLEHGDGHGAVKLGVEPGWTSASVTGRTWCWRSDTVTSW